MNIYEKIQAVRVDLEKENLRMSGKNAFAKYDYFELDDFVKPLNALMHKYKMTAYPSFTPELATLTAVDCEKPEDRVTVTSPMGTADLKGCHEVQNIGAVETYQRRYLYQALFDITEKDGLNATQSKPEQSPIRQAYDNTPQSNNVTYTPPNEYLSASQRVKQIEHMTKGTKFGVTTANEYASKKFNKGHIDMLNDTEFNDLFAALSAAIRKEYDGGK